MEEISRSVRQAKQAKFLDADCTCPYSPYSPYGDVAGPYRSYEGDVAAAGWSIIGEYGVDTCHKWLIRCGHVAQFIGATCPYMTG
jgi:hypothetical protein